MIKKAVILLFIIIFFLTGFGVYHYLTMQHWLHEGKGAGTAEIAVLIPQGCSVRGALHILVENQLVSNSPYIRLVGKIGESVPDVRSGEYLFKDSQSPVDMLKAMRQGKVRTYAFTIPEGYSTKDIGQTLEKLGFGSLKELESLSKDDSFLSSLEIPWLEGYLFPDTYRVPRNAGLKAIVRMMVKNLRKQVGQEIEQQAKQRGLTIEKTLIIASIAEKESGSPAEYPIVSSVIHNRLKRKMLLQMDPTVIYGIPDFNGNLTRRHLRTDHPWNTYVRTGLPPTPICNPGLGAIRAAVNPAKTSYLYFVSMNNGSHKFTSTLREHNKAVQLYQVRRKVGP